MARVRRPEPMTSPAASVLTVELDAVARHETLVVAEPQEIGAERFARDERGGLDVGATLCGNLPARFPIADDALGYAERAGQLADPSGGLDG